MTAVLIPFKPRAGCAEAVVGCAQVIEFPPRPYSLTAGDVALLEALAPTLDGAWTCEILVNGDGDAWAAFEAHHAPPLIFFVCRSGRRLRLFNMEGEAAAEYATAEALAAILAEAIGQWAAAL